MKHAGTQTIKTLRLTLRRIEISDAEMIYNNWANDGENSRYMRWKAHKDIEETYATIREWFYGYKDENTYHWGIGIENGELIGSIGIIITSEYDFKGEIAYCIGRNYWGQGYVTEAAKAVIDYMFTNTDIERIEAYHSVNNPASGKVMAKAGMTREGFAKHKYRTPEDFQDCDYYGIIREEWENKT